MKKSFRGLLAILLVISLLISLCPAVFAAPSATVIVTPATGYTSAEDVVYKTENGYLVNWGARDEDCLFLTTYAQDFYTGAYTYETLSKVTGGTNASNAPSSSLYTSLQSLMADRHTYYTKYDTSTSADCKPLYQNADCYGNDTTYVSTLYRGLKVNGPWDGGKSYNQEHVWPKSKLQGTKYTDIGDIMALRAANPNENSSRNNTAYGESAGFYDPGVSVRGDCARTLLYMYVRWGNTTTAWGADGAIESLDVLLRWIEEDPVDTWEMAHNDVVQSITGTRNVFVDYPEYAFQLFGREVPSDMLTPSDGGHGNTGAVGTATLVTSASSLKAGDQIIIAALGYDYALSTTQNASNRGQVGVTKSSSGLSYDADAQIITLATGTTSGTFGFKVDGNQYLYAASSSSNQLKTKSTLDANGSFKITIASNGAAAITASGTATRNVLRYNASSSIFSCYAASNSQKDIAIYKLSGSGGSSTCSHSYTSKITTAATCTGTGVRTYTCSKCSHSYTVSVAALGHNYSSSVTKAETCTTSGVRTFTCTVCRDSYTTTIPAAGHSYSGGRCSVCGQANPNCSHSYTGRTTASATCTTQGVKTYTCSKCGDVYTEAIPATGHSYSSFISTSPGCTTSGQLTYRCSSCGDSYTDSLAATGHSYVSGKCTNCGGTDPNYSADFYLFGYINGSNYACEEDGDNLGKYKFVNGQLTVTFDTEAYVAVKRGNNADWYMTNGWMGTDATCAVLYNTDINTNPDKLFVPGGVEVVFTLIDNGDDTLFLSYETTACAHQYSSHISVTPSCTIDGQRTYTCSVCYDKYTEVIPATGHSYSGNTCLSCGHTRKTVTLVTKVSDLKSGDQILIVAKDYDFALSTTQNSANRGQAAVIKSGSTLDYGVDAQVITLQTGTVGGTFAFLVDGQYLYASSSSANQLKTTNSSNANGAWSISIASSGVATIKANGTSTRNVLRYNAASGLFSCYSSSGSVQDVCIYKLGTNSRVCDHNYTVVVNRQPTCVSTGLSTYTCNLCGDCYMESTPYASHSFVGGKCTLCGSFDSGYSAEYYLFGFINGANYACEEDFENLGAYKFVGGKLTATFETEGYVGIKTGDNANWYMTDGWQGMETTSVTLYNTGRLTNADKLYVPGGVQLTFTLKVNSDDTLTLSYTTAAGCDHSYTSKITTSATCTTTGVKTYTCSKCDDSYTEIIAIAGHSYAGGKCSFCGATDPGYNADYYLFGYINGANYACEEDFENLGAYKFVGGKLTATFNEDGYVGIKTGDNANWYMTDGWQGMEATSVTLYNSGRLTNPDKLFVPGGVQLTFTLKVNSDDSLTLSYTTGSISCSHSYSGAITTQPTCTTLGVKTYTCSKCGDSYTETMATVGHSYVNGSCSFCGKADPSYGVSYYLFGFINGSNYACEEDFENLGQYQFVNGKLTATFSEDGYVGVKTGDNASWYMTDGWQGLDVTSVTLYNTGRLTNADKLYVPGGVKLTFTLTVNSDDTLTLSYTSGSADCSHSYRSAVTVAPTCTNPGVKTFTCERCGHSYTETLVATGHNYVSGSCTACGTASPDSTVDYYLFGYINGNNYACEEDFENLGIYKFVGGKLTTAFNEDGYVGIKTGDNASWYMTDGWQGLDATSVTLYNSGRLTNPDKLYVPGGVQLTFTLKVNSDDTLSLSYAPTVCSHDYTCEETTPATCTENGVNTYICLSCGHSYTETVVAEGHQYVGNQCTACGDVKPVTADYYLFGYINGGNYACEEDFENAGSYKFVGGKLTATFTEDSYVGVKTGDNSVWYMTEDWQGLDTTSVTLYDTGRLSNPDKLYVPGGVKLIFTLTANQDGTLTLSYAQASGDCSHSYTATVTTPATCTDPGVKTFVCGLCGESYTQAIAPTGHSYVGGSCTACGMAEPSRGMDYYLFGWINGANYACEEDGDNLGVYKFVNGKLTATFSEDSYVGIKTGDNVSWYMTEGWQGTEAASATLFKTNVLTNPDKLFVPGGVALTFTLTENIEGSLTLSYTQGPGCEHNYTTQVTANATCITNGQQIHTCTLCGHSYTASIAALGHRFQGDKCSVCGVEASGSPADTYYLFGFINGADCGYDSDLENLGYEFVGGSLVITFSEDSYVAVKTGDNANWYYTAEWLGTETTTATLHPSGASDPTIKLYVPGGVQLIFTLTENANGTLTLSYVVSGCVYTSQITTYPTCNAEGIRTYTCSDCGHSYTEAIAPVGHSYENGICITCGKADPGYGISYYLFGYINGADYGCESDWENVGSYKFENGRLTATFEKDSYVAVKTGDNKTWYMTDGWQNFNANCVTLYNADTLANADKLFIPGGIPMVFTLIANNDGSLSLACVPDRCIHSYTSEVTLAPTCTTDGELTYSCDNCTCFYTEIIAATGHSFANGVCTVCGGQNESRGMSNYYLFGYINGADYACESDWQNVGNFRFSSNNTCSVTFSTDSYVGVKKVSPGGDEVVAWYMTNGWLGFDARNATLYNTNALGGNADKLFVPGGVRLTFKLVENADGTLVLSYGNVVCDHSYGVGKITTQATCFDHGVRAYTCSLCGHFYEEVIPATGHSCFNGVCIGCGAADPNEGCCANHNYQLTSEVLPSCTTAGSHTSRAACGATYTEELSATGHSYNARVITAATCDLPGIKTYTCVCGDSYSEPIEPLGHQYQNGYCKTCGANQNTGDVADQSYYLFGYINGADYGVGDDWQTLGEYKFVGGQLTVTFDADSYVAIKTGDNNNWYMTQSFVTGTSATFYHTNTGVYEKMFIPGGVRVTFTLTENADGTLGLSYTTSSAGSSVILPTMTLQYPTLSFKDEVKLNIYYDVSDMDNVVDMGLVIFSSQVSSYTVYNAESVVSGYNYSPSAGLYTVTTNGIPAKNMGDTIWFAVYAQLDNGTYCYTKLVDYSPRTYAYSLLGTGDAKLDALLVSMLNYGAAAQTYFGYNTGNLLNNGLTAAQRNLVAAYDASMIPNVAKPSSNKQGGFSSNGGFDDLYPSVTFGGAFAINYYAVPSYIPADGVTLYYWTEAQYNSVKTLTQANVSGQMKMTNNGVYRASVSGISAKDICDGVYVTMVYSNGTKTYRSGVLPYSIGLYCEALAEYENDFTPFAKATAVYGYYAKQYFG